MQKINELMQVKAQELLAKGEIKKVLAWKVGEFFYDNAPAAFETEASCSEIIYRPRDNSSAHDSRRPDRSRQH